MEKDIEKATDQVIEEYFDLRKSVVNFTIQLEEFAKTASEPTKKILGAIIISDGYQEMKQKSIK